MRKLLLCSLVAILPLIIHVRIIEFPIEVLSHFKTSQFQPDIFNWWKNALLYSVAAMLTLWGWNKLTQVFKNLVGIYFGSVVVSSVLSNYPEVAWFGMPNYLEGAVAAAAYCVLFLSAADVAMDVSSLYIPLSICTCGMLATCALQYFNADWFRLATHFIVFGRNSDYQMSIQAWPLFGTLMNANITGTFAALVYSYFLSRGKWVLTLVSVLIAVGSQSRGAWLAMAITTLYLGFKCRTWKLAAPFVFFGLGIGMVYLHPTHGGFKWAINSSGRIYLWKKTIEITHPSALFYGYGPGAFALEFPNDDAKGKIAQGWTPETVVDRPHNFYLQTLHASGGMSLAALLMIFAKFFLESKELAINAAVLSYLVNVFFTDSCTSVAPLFWIILGTGVGRLKVLKKEKL